MFVSQERKLLGDASSTYDIQHQREVVDKIGFGKTTTTIGLIAGDVSNGQRRAERQYLASLESYFECKATLISCPPNLVEQWENEFLKFLGATGVEISKQTPMPLAKDFATSAPNASSANADSGQALHNASNDAAAGVASSTNDMRPEGASYSVLLSIGQRPRSLNVQ